MTIDSTQKASIDDSRLDLQSTLRPTIPALEEILFKPIQVLDHGFIRLIDYMGDDAAIVQAARVSYGKGTKQVSQDRGLIRYLMRHRHTTPFEMCDIKFHIKLPIFIARQWIRHRTASVNEYSARYSILGNEFYIPKREHLSAQSKINAQGREDHTLNDEEAAWVMELLKRDATNVYGNYQNMLNEDEEGKVFDESKDGLARELARMNLTLNFYTEWYWKINLHNLLHFLHLRADSHAQYEIRAYAIAMLDIVKRWVPFAHEAFMDYRVNSVEFSEKGLDVVKQMIQGKRPTKDESGLTKREWNELMEALDMESELV